MLGDARTRASSARTTTSTSRATGRATASRTRRARGTAVAARARPRARRAAAASRDALRDAGSTRRASSACRPALDDKVLTAWNGLMISRLRRGPPRPGRSRATWRRRPGRPASCCARCGARRAASAHAAARARAGIDAFLEDYAYLGEALVDLYEAGGAEELPARGARARRAHPRATSPRTTAASSRPRGPARRSIVRHREGHDGATPSANAKAARAPGPAGRAPRPRRPAPGGRAGGRAPTGSAIARQPRAFCVEPHGRRLPAGGPGRAGLRRAVPTTTAALRRAVAAHYLPNRVVGHVDPDAGGSALPLLAGKTLVGGRAALYVCRDFACQAPVTEPDAVAAGARWRPRPHGGGPPAGPRPSPAGPRPRARRATPRAMPRACPTASRPLGPTGLTVQPPRLRRLPRRRRDARAPARAGARPRRRAATSSTPRRTTRTAAASA